MSTTLDNDTKETDSAKDIARGIDRLERYANLSPAGRLAEEDQLDAAKNADNVQSLENAGSSAPWQTNISPTNNTNQQGGSKRGTIRGARSFLRRNKKFLFGVGGLGVGGTLVLLGFFAIMPLRLEMFISNISQQASRVPSYAVEKRINYLVTRALATRILMLSDSNVDGNLVFCKDAGIACSLFKTYTTSFIEKKYDINLNRQAWGVEVRVTPEGRSRLSGPATSWRIETSRLSGTDGAKLTSIVKEIDNNTDMKLYIGKTIDKKMPDKSIVSRYIAKKVLYRKWGVTSFRGFERQRKTIAEVRTDIKTKTLTNTVGKVSSKAAMYVACISTPSVCAKTLNTLKPTAVDLERLQMIVDNAPPDEKVAAQKELDRAKSLQSYADDLTKRINGQAFDDALAKTGGKDMSKFAVNQLVSKAAGPASIIFGLDIVFRGIESVENGVLSEIRQDINMTSFIGFAYGNDTGVITNTEKMKATGFDNNDFDLEAYGEIVQMFDGAESNPLMAYENGTLDSSLASIFTPSVSAADGSYSALCETDKGIEKIALEPGEVVCPNMHIVQDYTDSAWTNNPGWATIAAMAGPWTDTISVVIDLVMMPIEKLTSLIFSVPVLRDIVGWISDTTAPIFAWILGLFFAVPLIGVADDEESKAIFASNNYSALSGGIRSYYADTMKYGVDENGDVLGGGGSVISDAEVAAINSYYDEIEREELQNAPVLAKLFDTSMRGSLVQQLAIYAPTSTSGAINGLMRLPTSFASVFTPKSSATTSITSNPFKIINYGYTSEAIFNEDPGVYDATRCEELARAREDSFQKIDDYPVAVYTKSDPCALEKMATGTILTDAGVTDDENSL
ncbi:hypothetical protein EOL96_07620 [Candidatus Saccharibacteria bacterium]|nr:hypothetical protein [Candidatus Saccharibacteria bacterium]